MTQASEKSEKVYWALVTEVQEEVDVMQKLSFTNQYQAIWNYSNM